MEIQSFYRSVITRYHDSSTKIAVIHVCTKTLTFRTCKQFLIDSVDANRFNRNVIDLINMSAIVSSVHPLPPPPYPSSNLSLLHPIPPPTYPSLPYTSCALYLLHPIPPPPYPSATLSLLHPIPPQFYPSSFLSPSNISLLQSIPPPP